MVDIPNDILLLSADLKTYLVAPLNQFGLGGFLFDIDGEATARLEAEITDHFTENNKAVNDHIARRPKNITMRGYVGELVHRPDGDSGTSILQSLTQRLTEVTDFLPQVSAATKQLQSVATNQAIGFSEGVTDAADIYGVVKNLIGATGDMAGQQKAYLYFKACWEQGILMGIQTPWEYLTNMAIESITAVQGEGSTEISDFSIRFKQIRISQTKSSAYKSAKAQSGGSSSSFLSSLGSSISTAAASVSDSVSGIVSDAQEAVQQGVAAVQAAVPVNLGNISGASLPSSLLAGAQSQIGAAEDLLKNPSILKQFEYQAGGK